MSVIKCKHYHGLDVNKASQQGSVNTRHLFNRFVDSVLIQPRGIDRDILPRIYGYWRFVSILCPVFIMPKERTGVLMEGSLV